MERKKMTAEAATAMAAETDGWKVEGTVLRKRFDFANFAESLAFVNNVGQIAEASNHHPDITFGWGYAELSSTTHDRGGITDVDFALIKKIDRLGDP